METAPRADWWAYAAACWAFAFALYSLYGALGGDLGVDQLANDIREQAEERDPGFVAQLWAAAALKLIVGLLALALVQDWGRTIPSRPLRVATWLVAIGLIVYGAANLIRFGLMDLGVIDTPDSVGSYAVSWYVFLWEPIWLLGGVLFAAAAWRFGASSPR
jgi:hypothetical protein